MDMKKLDAVVTMLVEGKPLPMEQKDHVLSGDLQPFRECHIEPDWLLVYKKDDKHIYFARTGTHSDLF